ncbi:psychosine receptor-like [Littorina saxatilis]|uniref:psychosine receptor-like n=1 Tax=Littorina saxatilis TaxID=31220 RepID=UPI0038B45D56
MACATNIFENDTRYGYNDLTSDVMTTDCTPSDLSTPAKLQGILSPSAFKTVEFTLDCGFRPLLFFLGAPTNILNMIVFARQGLRDRMNLCLFSLAVADLFYVTSKFVMASYCFVGDLDPFLREVWKFTVRKYAVACVFATLYSSGALTMIIAVERCVCVVFPMKAANTMKTRTMAALIVLSVVIVCGLCSVYVLKYDVKVDYVSSDDSFVTLKASQTYLRHKVSIDVIENVVLSSITFVNFVIVSMATVITVVKLKHAMTWRKARGTVTSAEQRHVTLVKMLVTVSCIYITCTAPTISVALVRMLVPEFWPQRRYHGMYFVAHIAATVVLMVNSSVNFFVYVTQSSRFRVELRALVCVTKDAEKKALNGSLSNPHRPDLSSSGSFSRRAK